MQAVAALSAISYAKPVNNHVSHEKRSTGYTQYSKRSRVDSDAVLPIRIGLKQSGLEKGYERLMDVYVAVLITHLSCIDPKQLPPSFTKLWKALDVRRSHRGVCPV